VSNLPAATACPSPPNCSYDWNVNPDLFTGKARIRVTAFDNASNIGADDSDANFVIAFYERFENPANPSVFELQHPATALRRWYVGNFSGGATTCPGDPAGSNAYDWFVENDDSVFGFTQGNHSQDIFLWDRCQVGNDYFYPPNARRLLDAGAFTFIGAANAFLQFGAQWDLDPEDFVRLAISTPLPNETANCFSAGVGYTLYNLRSGTSTNFGTQFDTVTVDLTPLTPGGQPVIGTIRCIGLVTWDVDGDGGGGAGAFYAGLMIDDYRVWWTP
jgi:hypothetical protein